MENKKIIPIPEIYRWKNNEIPKIPVQKNEKNETQNKCNTETIFKNNNKEKKNYNQGKNYRK